MHSYLYGFEDYNAVSLYGNFIENNYPYVRVYDNLVSSIFIPAEGLPIVDNPESSRPSIDNNIIKDHKELIAGAKTVYVHKNCSISRALVSTKYKKTLNPWVADIVVIPRTEELKHYIEKVAFFICESPKTIMKKTAGRIADNNSSYGKTDIAIWNMAENQELGDIVPKDTEVEILRYPMTQEDLMHSTLLYKGEICTLDQNEGYILDIFTNSIPKDKIVFEDTLQSALGSEENQITLETLLSIYDMLESKDEDVVNAGLKALSMMDYAHYSNSVIYMLHQVNSNNYRWCKASNSTAVKFMLRHLCGEIRTYRRSTYLGESDTVYEEDYELYKQLVEHFDKRDNMSILDKMRYVNFMTINSESTLVPRLKETA